MMAEEASLQETLFIEQFAALLGFDTISRRLFDGVYPPYLLIVAALFVDFGVVNTYKHLTGTTHILISAPTYGAVILALLLAAVGIRYMANGYAEAVADLQVDERDANATSDELAELVSNRTKVAAYFVAVVATYGYLLFDIGLANLIAFEGGYVGLLNPFVVWPLGYIPFAVEFSLLYFSIHFRVPAKIRAADVGLFYYDPRDMGGFASIGQLLKRSYYLFTACLLLYLIVTYGPIVLPMGSTPDGRGLTSILFFSTAWFVGVLSISYSMLSMHRYMADKKESHIRQLEDEIRDTIDRPYEITSPEQADEELLQDLQRRLEQVRRTRAYPATFRMGSQIALSVLLPQALQFAVQATI